MTSDRQIEDYEIEQAMREADDMEKPSPEHVSDLRAALLARTAPAVDQTPVPASSLPPRHRWLAYSVAAVIAASLLAIILPRALAPPAAFAAVLAKAREQVWVHAITEMQHGEQKAESESWYSPVHRIAAVRHPMVTQLTDFESGIAVRYKPDVNRIYKTRADATGDIFSRGSAFIEALMNEANHDTLFPGHKVSKPAMSKVTVNNKEWAQYSFRVEYQTDANRSRRIDVRVDPETDLVSTWEERYSNGMCSTTRFEYPQQGPEDIYALGVPKAAEVVDRIACSDVTTIAEAFQKGRTEFDDYDAVFVQHVEGRDASPLKDGLMIRRVRRLGNKHRVDYLLRAMPGVEAPTEGADMATWWNENREKFWSVPTLICSGKTRTTYLMVDDLMPKEGKPNLEVALRMSNPVSGFPHDPTVAWPHLMPEFSSRPHLWTTLEARSFSFDPVPDDGPEGSVRVVITREEDEVAPERARYWFDPEHGFCVVKAVEPVIRKDRGKPEIAYTNTERFENFNQTPKGHWYPRRSRRTTTQSEIVQVREYYLDFDVSLDDALFTPLTLSE
ncbi:MAG: hypothetical protein H8E44_05095 [Planctomycetes bacterium]|nr:hypothetical protein [Planctomycetota bacterium]